MELQGSQAMPTEHHSYCRYSLCSQYGHAEDDFMEKNLSLQLLPLPLSPALKSTTFFV